MSTKNMLSSFKKKILGLLNVNKEQTIQEKITSIEIMKKDIIDHVSRLLTEARVFEFSFGEFDVDSLNYIIRTNSFVFYTQRKGIYINFFYSLSKFNAPGIVTFKRVGKYKSIEKQVLDVAIAEIFEFVARN